VWDDTFPTDEEADAEFRKTVQEEGIGVFREHVNVVPFPRR
jgi:hypothetical protein